MENHDRSSTAAVAYGPRENRLRELLQEAYPGAEVSDALRLRVAGLADTSVAPAPRRSRWPLRGAFALGVALVAAIAMVFPRLSAEAGLRRMESAVRDVPSAHLRYWTVRPDGQRVAQSELWYQAGRWRLEEAAGRRTQICVGGQRWTYEGRTEELITEKAIRPDGYDDVTGFSLTSFLHDEQFSSHSMRLSWGPTRRIGWTVLSELRIDAQDGSMRVVTYVDRARDLPVSIECWRKDEGGWRLEMGGEMSFGERFADRLFRPEFPGARKQVDIDQLRAEWRRKLAPGIAAEREGGRQVVIRDLWVGKGGVVFLLYTAGRMNVREPARQVELSDDAGNVYLDGQLAGRPLTPATAGVKDGQTIGLTTAGAELLDLAWWVPLGEAPKQPHHFVLSFPADSRRPASPKERPLRFVLRAPDRSPEAVPGYAPAMFSAPTEVRIKESAAMVRSKYFERAGDPWGAAAQWQTLIDTEDREAKTGGVEGDPGLLAAWLIHAHALYLRCGDRAAAHSALLRADATYRSDGLIRSQIRQLLAQEEQP